jgi:hypothetical protein
MVYELAQDQHIPVGWAINPNKAVYGADFTARGKSYSGGPFIIEAPSAARSTVARWQAQGVVVNKINTAFVAPPAGSGYVDLAGGVVGAPAAVPRTPRLET